MDITKEEDQEMYENQEIHLGDEFSYDVKIPQDRVAVLIGKEGSTKKKIESESTCQLDVTAEGAVTIKGNDAIALFATREIVRAIGRGFNPNIALELLKTDYILEILSLKDVVGSSKSSIERLKGRIIGKAGKSRAILEDFTGTKISVYGKTVGIIGEAMAVTLAHQAVSMLLAGAMHKSVFKFLEKKRKEDDIARGIIRVEEAEE